MTSQNRATRIAKLHSLLKKAYKPIIPVDSRSLRDHLLYACLLENAPYELADEALARVEQDYFDLNEVRVTTITELSEVLARLPDPMAAALRLKKNLHGLFESRYSFDLEDLRKQNLGKAQQIFEKLPAITPFILSYLTQYGLGGHAVPLDSAALRFFWLCDIISENELKTGRVTGLERAIPKNKGIEFSSLLHQAAVAINLDPNDGTARGIVLELNPALDQQLADHVAAVKERRVAKAKAKEEAAAREVEIESQKSHASKGDAKGVKGKTAKPAPKKGLEEMPKHEAPDSVTHEVPKGKEAAPKKAPPAKQPAAKIAPQGERKPAAEPVPAQNPEAKGKSLQKPEPPKKEGTKTGIEKKSSPVKDGGPQGTESKKGPEKKGAEKETSTAPKAVQKSPVKSPVKSPPKSAPKSPSKTTAKPPAKPPAKAPEKKASSKTSSGEKPAAGKKSAAEKTAGKKTPPKKSSPASSKSVPPKKTSGSKKPIPKKTSPPAAKSAAGKANLKKLTKKKPR